MAGNYSLIIAILIISIGLQLLAAFLALQLVKVTTRRTAWILIATSVSLMAIRRIITLYRLLSGDSSRPPDLTAELVALVISILMLSGIGFIAPLFKEILDSDKVIRTSEEKYRLLVEQANDGILVVDLNKNIVDVNTSFSLMLGYSRLELLQLTIDDIIPSGEMVKVPWQMDTIQQHGRLLFERVLLRKDGTELLTEINASLIGKNRIQGIIRDITARKEAERLLNVHAKQQETVSMLGQLALSNISLIEFMNEAVTRIADTLDIKLCKILEATPGGDSLLLKVGVGWDPGLVGKVYVGTELDSQAGYTLIASEPVVVEDLRTETRFTGPDLLTDHKVISGMSVIIAGVGNKPYGVLGAHCRKGTFFTQDDINFLQSIANLLAEAIRQDNDTKLIQEQLANMAALHQVDMAIAGNADLSYVCDIVLEQGIQQLGVSAADLLLLDPGSQILSCVAAKGFRTSAIMDMSLRNGEGFAGRAAFGRRLERVENLPNSKNFIRSELVAQEGFYAYLGIPLISKGQTIGVLEFFHTDKIELNNQRQDFLEHLALQTAIAIDTVALFDDLQRSNAKLIHSYDATLSGWVRALERKDAVTEGHTHRVVELTVNWAKELGFSSEELVHIRRGALLHDIGKIGIPDSILGKVAPLTPEELEIVQKHPDIAFEILAPIDFLRPALDIPYSHHEHWDGGGYPRGLSGEQIPIAARIFAYVDVWDALLSDRPYRDAWMKEDVIAYMKSQSGKYFDPNLLDSFLKFIELVDG